MSNPYRKIPKIDRLLQHKKFHNLNKKILTQLIRDEIDRLRDTISNNPNIEIDEDRIIQSILDRYHKSINPSLIPLINATGIIIHTNLGRSLIDRDIFDDVKEIACNYSNLEYDLQEGKRGDRYRHIKDTLTTLFGVEDILIVNNNASAVFLILNTFAKDKEVVVSRGELVEIGGGFRIPDVMKSSGAKLIEVGTTNKTYIKDYEEAISQDTAMLMKVHKSNYKIVGFSTEVEYRDIKRLSEERGVLDYYDLGSAYLPKLPYNLDRYEPSIFELLKLHPSLISFSGDKLFGGVQAGIILGKREYISKLKKNQLLRMFRVDKLTLAILERVAISYIKEEYEKIPTLKLLSKSLDEMRDRAKILQNSLPFNSQIVTSHTFVGGGAMPNIEIPTISLLIEGDAKELERLFRSKHIIGRIEQDSFLLDMRTLRDIDIDKIIEAFR